MNKLFRCVIKARSSQKSRLLCQLCKAKIVIWDVVIDGNYITFTVKIKDLPKTFAILKNMCYNYSVCSRYDLKSLAKSAVKRVGILIGTCLSVAFIAIANNFVVGVRIGTDNAELRDKILALSSMKNSVYAMKNSVDTRSLQEQICNLDGVADCSVRLVGNYLQVDILESPQREDREQTYSSYVSRYDATVTSVIAKKGTPLVKVGDRIFAGAPLISPNAFNENGEVIATTGISGKVVGEIVLRKTITVDKLQSISVKTGNSKTYTSFLLTPAQIPSPYKLYEKTVTTQKFNVFIPLIVTKTEFVELEERLIETDVEQFAKTALEEFVIDCGQIGEQSFYSYKEVGEQYVVSLYVKTITEIGVGT